MSEREKRAHVLAFPGGDTVVCTPKPDELLLSAQQWITRAREELYSSQAAAFEALPPARRAAALSALAHASRALNELKGHV